MSENQKPSEPASAELIKAETAAEELFAPEKELETLHEIPDYLDVQTRAGNGDAAAKAMLARLDEKIAQFDLNDLSDLTDYGTEALTDLNAVCEKIVQNQRVRGTFLNIDDIRRKVSDQGISGLDQRLAEFFEKRKPVEEEAGGFFSRMFTSAAETEARRKQAQTERSRQIEIEQEALMQDMRRQAVKSIQIETELRNANHQIKSVQKSIETLGLSQIKAYRELAVFIGAGRERLRRLSESELPEKRKEFEESMGSFMLKEELDDMYDSYLALQERVDDLTAEHGSNLVLFSMLRDRRNYYHTVSAMIAESLDSTTKLWKELHHLQGLIRSEEQHMAWRENVTTHHKDLLKQTVDTINNIGAGNVDAETTIQTLTNLGERFKKVDEMLGKLEEGRVRIDNARTESGKAVADAMGREMQIALDRVNRGSSDKPETRARLVPPSPGK